MSLNHPLKNLFQPSLSFPLFTYLAPFIVPLLAKIGAAVMGAAATNESNNGESVNHIGGVREEYSGAVGDVEENTPMG